MHWIKHGAYAIKLATNYSPPLTIDKHAVT